MSKEEGLSSVENAIVIGMVALAVGAGTANLTNTLNESLDDTANEIRSVIGNDTQAELTPLETDHTHPAIRSLPERTKSVTRSSTEARDASNQ